MLNKCTEVNIYKRSTVEQKMKWNPHRVKINADLALNHGPMEG